jgi:hypothetical protein
MEVDKISADSVEFGIRLKNTRRPDQPDQKYYWLSDQRPDEPVMFISWDPRDSGVFAGKKLHRSTILTLLSQKKDIPHTALQWRCSMKMDSLPE